MNFKSCYQASAYGGNNWSPRTISHRDEIGSLWTKCGIGSEWRSLKAVMLHPPGEELSQIQDPESVQMLAIPNLELAQKQHQIISRSYRRAGITVHYVNPNINTPPPNLIFCADLFLMTPEGAILGRPASTVRAGEERWIARRLADLGIPILATITGNGTFEGADVVWVDPQTAILANGLRTNHEGANQVAQTLKRIGVNVVRIDLPHGSMHLMGILRFLDKDLAIAWPHRLAFSAVQFLKEQGYEILLIPDEKEATQSSALNFVTLGPREILMASGNPNTQKYLEQYGVICHKVNVSELLKAAGGIGCLTGVLERATE
jgi:arginine deiminase